MLVIPLLHYRRYPAFLKCSYPSDVCMQPCESVSNHPLPCESYQSFKIFEISTPDFGTVSMHRRFCTCTYEFLTRVTEGMVHNISKVVIWSSLGVMQ